jgi:membrane-associated phospholipid phosphatase
MQALADLVARHAIAVLIAGEIVLLFVTVAFWRLVHRYAPLFRPIVKRYPAVLATLAFGAAAAAIVVFFEVVDEIEVGESLADFDVALTGALRQHLSHGTVRAFAVITHLGDTWVLIALGAAVAAVLLAQRRWTLAAAWAAATISGGLLNRMLKGIFERTRPLHDHGLVSETSWSFPSGHASGSMIVYGLLAYIIVRNTRPAWHIPVALVCLTLIVFVGSSRILLQVHYLSDVIAGYAVGSAWVALWIAGLEATPRRPSA